ncbi:hypothetical protein BDW75DRAFT_186351 [Aspergillus navahoensis]
MTAFVACKGQSMLVLFGKFYRASTFVILCAGDSHAHSCFLSKVTWDSASVPNDEGVVIVNFFSAQLLLHWGMGDCNFQVSLLCDKSRPRMCIHLEWCRRESHMTAYILSSATRRNSVTAFELTLESP